MKPEFSRTYRIDTLGAAPREISIEADEAERAALAQRFELPAIGALCAEATLTRSGDAVLASGTARARVTQSCVATGEPVAAGPEEEIELGEGELDVVFYDAAAIDLGEAVAGTVSLALDPYPRSEAAEQALREAGVKEEEEAKAESSPFAALGALKDKLK